MVTAPTDNRSQEKFLGYTWSNRKGQEGMQYINEGGLLYDKNDHEAENTIAALVRNIFNEQKISVEFLQDYYYYLRLQDMIDFTGITFNKAIRTSNIVKENADIISDDYPSDTIGNLCILNPSKSEVSSLPDDMMVSFIEMASLSNDGRIINSEDRTLAEVKKGSYKYFAEDDIIIAKITPCMENGKCAIARNLTNKIGFGSSEFHVFRCKDTILPEYLFCLLNREQVRKIAAKQMTGASGHRRVPIEFYENMAIPIPPLDIQKEIVNDLNVDDKIRAEEHFIKQCNENIKNKFNEMFSNKNFKTKTVDELYELQIGKTPSRNDQKYWTNAKFKWISIADMSNYDRYTKNTAEFINQIAIDETGIKIVPANTVIMSFKLTIGRTAITSENIYTNEAIAAFIDKNIEFIDKDYLRIYLSKYDWSYGSMNAVKGMTLNKKSIGEAVIQIPPEEEQRKFAEFVQSIEEQKNEAISRKELLIAQREKVLDKYFR